MSPRVLLAIAASFVSAASFWLFLPLLSVRLRAEGVNDAEVGLMSGLPWLGVLLVAWAIPGLIHRMGLQRMVLLGMAVGIVAILGFSAATGVVVWAVLCLGLGASLGLRWSGMDTWINGAVPEHLRGRLIGAYELVMSGSMAAGPAALSLLGDAGARPFLGAAAALGLAMALLALAGREQGEAEVVRERVSGWAVLRGEPAAFIGIGLVGLTEACNLSLLPVMGLGLGLDVHRAALLVVGCQTAVALGALGCGVLADHLNRRALKLGTGVVMCLVPLAVPVVLHGPGVWLALPLWGAAQGGLFTVGMVKLGTRFSGATLARAMALSMVIYTLGGLFGPPALGAVMALLGSAGLVYGLAAVAVVGTGVIASL